MMFRSFIMGGFECATGYNARGNWIDLVAATHHDALADEDYARLAAVGIYAAREAVRWPLVDLGKGRYDFSSVQPFVDAAQKHGVDVIWDLFHFGFPAGLDLFTAEFPRRFADYCHAVAMFLRSRQPASVYFTPINEPSYFAWAAGEVARFAPYAIGRGPELKRALARAAIWGIDAIRSVLPGARIVNVDPLCHVALPFNRPDLEEEVRSFNEVSVWESWDMISGRMCPELGGTREHLDIIGVNYYATNQWELGCSEIPLGDGDPRRVDLRTLLRRANERYGGEMILTETAHVDDMRSRWLEYVTGEAAALLDEGFPLRGVCLYPILSMPDWHAPDEWVNMGLWDLRDRGNSTLARELCPEMLVALRSAQRLESPLHVAVSGESNP